jgi:hypothetical protein
VPICIHLPQTTPQQSCNVTITDWNQDAMIYRLLLWKVCLWSEDQVNCYTAVRTNRGGGPEEDLKSTRVTTNNQLCRSLLPNLQRVQSLLIGCSCQCSNLKGMTSFLQSSFILPCTQLEHVLQSREKTHPTIGLGFNT